MPNASLPAATSRSSHIFLVLEAKKRHDGQYDMQTVAVAASTSKEAECLWACDRHDCVEVDDVFVMTDGAIADALAHGSVTSVFAVGGRNPPMSEATYQGWQKVYTRPRWSDGQEHPAVYRKLDLCIEFAGRVAGAEASQGRAFSDEELSVLIESLHRQAARDLGRRKAIAEQLIARLGVAISKPAALAA
ncbi:MAG: hypothetical protein AB7O55_16505 [Lautropia sp.]